VIHLSSLIALPSSSFVSSSFSHIRLRSSLFTYTGSRSAPSIWRRPSVAKKVSGASTKDQQEVLSKTYSIIDVPGTFECLQAFYDVASDDDVLQTAAASIERAVLRCPEFQSENLSGGAQKLEGEEAMHSRFFSAFHLWWASLDQESHPVLWFHEHRLFTLSKVDAIGFFNIEQPEQHLQPAVLMEFVLETTTPFHKKLAQLQAQARNACHVSHNDLLPHFLGVLFDPSTFKFEVHAFVGAEEKSLADVILVRGNRAQLPALLSLLQTWCSKLRTLPISASASMRLAAK
jgi:hypothetical protein